MMKLDEFTDAITMLIAEDDQEIGIRGASKAGDGRIRIALDNGQNFLLEISMLRTTEMGEPNEA